MQTATNVARWFLSRNRVKMMNGGADFISNLKLQKLLYYAQGLHLALWVNHYLPTKLLHGNMDLSSNLFIGNIKQTNLTG